MPRVSVLLTCYNHMRFLPEALASVRQQTFQDYEIIAIDDGSTDGTREWLQQQQDIKRVFNDKNIGTYASLNLGLQSSTGEFVAILNDDDVWLPKKLERQLDLFAAHPKIGLVHTGGYFIDGEGHTLEGSPLGFAFPRFATGDVLLGLVYENKIIASASLTRRECFQKLGSFNESYFGSGDWEMWFRVAEEYHVGFVDETLTLYRVHGDNASKKLDRIWVDDQMLREWMTPRLSKLDARFVEHDAKRAQAFNQAALGTVRALNGHPGKAREAYAKSISMQPNRLKSYLRYVATFLPRNVFRRTI